MTAAYYNEHDVNAAAWLANLTEAGLIPTGVIDSRDIQEVKADDVRGFHECHFFAGIGGWPLALRLAGWPATEAVWTGSCPCQPFSEAGKRKGTEDSRHLWPEFRRLIAECRPATVFGEQVASGLGREWLAGVRADLEALGYAVGAADLCAAGAGTPHIRQRLFWVGHSGGQGLARRAGQPGDDGAELPTAERAGGHAGGLEHSPGNGWLERGAEPVGRSLAGGRGDGFWSDFDIVHCADGKSRRFERGSFPLAPRIPGRVGRLRGYGNAIVPQITAVFIRAFIDATTPHP